MQQAKNKNNEQEQQQAQNRQNAEESIKAAHDEAEKDMEQDADLSIHSPNDDLDEAETARLGEDETGLV